ncbi:TlpA family protein disulfide reductase [Haloferula chungangensis]|uniref:TlpA family protein disulfide reductase n=1 Tax=Haloferula chungangensis TaxID=1048331 RepID=A0ABW2LDB5_9BACT
MFARIISLSAALVLPLLADPVKLDDLGTQIVGKPALTQSDLEGKLLVVHLWEAHCGACRTAVPAFEKEMRSKKKYATAVIVHRHDKQELAESVADDLGLKLPVFHNPKKIPQLKMKTWPCAIIITPDGEVAYSGSPGKDFDKALRDARKSLP